MDESLYSFFKRYSFTRKFKALFSSGRSGSWGREERSYSTLRRFTRFQRQIRNVLITASIREDLTVPTFKYPPPEFQGLIWSSFSPERALRSLWERKKKRGGGDEFKWRLNIIRESSLEAKQRKWQRRARLSGGKVYFRVRHTCCLSQVGAQSLNGLLCFP